jgi:hypothetical protein
MTETDLENNEEERNWRQDKLLTIDEIERLQRGGENIHLLKGKRNASKRDLYKDTEGRRRRLRYRLGW